MNRLSGSHLSMIRLINHRLSRNLGKYQVDVRKPNIIIQSEDDNLTIFENHNLEAPKTIAEIRALLEEFENPQQDDVNTYNIESLGMFVYRLKLILSEYYL